METQFRTLFDQDLCPPGDVIETERLVLRRVTRTDVGDHYVAWLANPSVNRYLETRWSQHPEASIIEFVEGLLGDPRNYLMAIVLEATGQHIGNIKLGPINANHSCADISYFIGEESMWGRGYATEAIAGITRFGFETLRLHRLQAGLYESNTGSEKALEKCGYRLEGRFAKQLRLEGDRWEDHLWYGLLNPAAGQ